MKFFIFIYLIFTIYNQISFRAELKYDKIDELTNIILHEILSIDNFTYIIPFNNFTFQQKIDFIGTINISFYNITLKLGTINNNTFKLNYLKDKNLLILTLQNLNNSLHANYSFLANFYQTNITEIVFSLNNCSISIINKLLNYRNRIDKNKYGPAIYFNEIIINNEIFDINFFPEGGKLEEIFKFIVNMFQDKFILYLNNSLNQYAQQINEIIKNFSKNNPLEYKFYNEPCSIIKYSQNEDPIMDLNHLSFPLELQLNISNKTYHGKNTDVKDIENLKYPFIIILNEYLLNSIMFHLFDLNFLKFNVTADFSQYLVVSTFKYPFPNITDEFGDNNKTDLIFYSFSKPDIEINNKTNLTLTLYETIELYVRDENESYLFDTLAVKGNYTFKIIPDFSFKNNSLNIQIKNISLVDFVNDNNKTIIDVDVNTVINGINFLFENFYLFVVNGYLKYLSGIIKEKYFTNLKNLIFETYENNLLIGLTDEDFINDFSFLFKKVLKIFY
jgi:hypothetical protein